MPHINIKNKVNERHAIEEVIVLQKWSKTWDWSGVTFGQSIGNRRVIDTAIKHKDYNAFQAKQRKGYWRVELKES